MLSKKPPRVESEEAPLAIQRRLEMTARRPIRRAPIAVYSKWNDSMTGMASGMKASKVA
jgi:hypothetical protein